MQMHGRRSATTTTTATTRTLIRKPGSSIPVFPDASADSLSPPPFASPSLPLTLMSETDVVSERERELDERSCDKGLKNVNCMSCAINGNTAASPLHPTIITSGCHCCSPSSVALQQKLETCSRFSLLFTCHPSCAIAAADAREEGRTLLQQQQGLPLEWLE